MFVVRAIGIEHRGMKQMRALAVLIIASCFGANAWSQQYEFVDPAGQVTARAEIQRGRMVVLDNRGETSSYVREARYDSPDGQFFGYVSVGNDRVLRFPRSGTGIFYSADLSEPQPQFRRAVRSVRPAQLAAPSQPYPSPLLPGYHDPSDYYGNGYYDSPFAPPIARRQSVLIDSEVVANAAVPPAVVNLHNSGNRELQVELVGLVSGIANETVRIAPGERRPVELQRDSGGSRIDSYRVISPTGDVFTKRLTTPVLPAPFYEVVVHEWAMQSIAIDRTGKSPNPIEDINYQGKGIGRFVLPAGTELTSGTIDVRRAALAAGNPGAVAPLVPTDDKRPSDEPLERALQDVLRQQRRAVQSGN